MEIISRYTSYYVSYNYVNIYVRMHKFCVVTVNPVFKGHCDEGHPVIRGHFLRTMSYIPHVKEPVTKGHFFLGY